ncbi:conserved unknown protein [Ectocarpus siliculosus]|uniref:Ribosome-binding factor A n=1 Tax=Ectocarpus siliculosus TaxID=2880 RepID=D8LBD9_ECTSI|nr:conserved unknown protein [Ectocarpus siliculosus]|eukprot:CBN76648.1 conserved unknown protein [Ectocarpus siliculosus]
MAVRSLVIAAALITAYGCREVLSFVGVSVLPRACSQQQQPQQCLGASGHGRCGWVGAVQPPPGKRRPTATVMMARGSTFRSTTESKRQARVSQLLTGELAKILRLGHGIKTKDKIDDDVRCRIAVVDVDMSPDLRSAKVFISVYGDVLEKREAYAWCVKNTKAIRMALCAELKGMKRVPELFFKDTDISAAVDLMALIDRVSGDEDGNEAALRDDGEEEIEGFEGVTEDDFFTFDFDEDGNAADFDDDDDDDEDVGFDLDEEERDGELV